MSFSLHDFLMNGFRAAIGQMPDYKVYVNTVGWFEKGVLTEEDLAEVQELIDKKNAPVEEPVFEEEPVEEFIEEPETVEQTEESSIEEE